MYQLEVDRVDVDARVLAKDEAEKLGLRGPGSDDGQTWKELGQAARRTKRTRWLAGRRQPVPESTGKAVAEDREKIL